MFSVSGSSTRPTGVLNAADAPLPKLVYSALPLPARKEETHGVAGGAGGGEGVLAAQCQRQCNYIASV